MEQSELESQVADFVKNVVNFRQMLIRKESLDLSNVDKHEFKQWYGNLLLKGDHEYSYEIISQFLCQINSETLSAYIVQYVSPNQSGGQEPQHHHVHSEVDCHDCLEDEDGEHVGGNADR